MKLRDIFSAEDNADLKDEWINQYIEAAITTDYQSIFYRSLRPPEEAWGALEPLDSSTPESGPRVDL